MAQNQPPYLLVGFVTLALLIVACGGIPIMLLMVSSQPTATSASPTQPAPTLPPPIEPKPAAKQPPVAEVQSAKDFATDDVKANKPSAPIVAGEITLKPSPMVDEDESLKSPATREWAAKTGGYRVVAKCLSYTDGVAVLEREDGKAVKVPLEKLSFADLQYVEDLIRVHPKAKIAIGTIDSLSGKYDLMFKTEAKSQIIRLYGVAFPEPEHPFYSTAREALETKLKAKSGWIEWFENSPDGYPLAMLYLNGKNANLEFVAEGFAWHDNRLDLARFANAETIAREKRLGLWSTDEVHRPWESAAAKK